MLKRLFLLWIFSGSLDSFSQDTARVLNTPDTLRAICLVTLFQNGIAHARMGYVVICEGKEVEYLDCRKRALKMPQVGWGYKLVNINNQKP